jgi:hypothetical protein
MSAEVATQLKAQIVEPVSESPFYIPMTGPAARPRRSLKHDDTFVVLDSHGDIGASAGRPDGLFNADTRYLARLELVLDEVQPLLLGSNLRDDNSALTVDLGRGRIVLQKDMLHIVRTIFLWRGTAYQRIGVQNHGESPASFDLTLLFDDDLRVEAFGRACVQRPVRRRHLHGFAAAARIVLRFSAREAARADAVPLRLRAAGIGEPFTLLESIARSRIRRGAAKSGRATHACRRFSTK